MAKRLLPAFRSSSVHTIVCTSELTVFSLLFLFFYRVFPLFFYLCFPVFFTSNLPFLSWNTRNLQRREREFSMVLQLLQLYATMTVADSRKSCLQWRIPVQVCHCTGARS